MLIDLTAEVPRIDAFSCQTTAIVRVRKVTSALGDVLMAESEPKRLEESAYRSMFRQAPVSTWGEGRDQQILDYRVSPGPNAKLDQAYSWRVSTAIPSTTRPWDHQTYWIVLWAALPPRLLLDRQESRVLLEITDFDFASLETAPDPSGFKKAEFRGGTLWDRLLRGDGSV